jgi:hypothetical protein
MLPAAMIALLRAIDGCSSGRPGGAGRSPGGWVGVPAGGALVGGYTTGDATPIARSGGAGQPGWAVPNGWLGSVGG